MTVTRHAKGTPHGGRFSAHEHTESNIALDYEPITNEYDTDMVFCAGCGEQTSPPADTSSSATCLGCDDPGSI